MLSHAVRCALGVVAALLSMGEAFCQSDSLALSSATTTPGGIVSLALSLNSPGGGQPAALQWTVSYPASALTVVTATAGAASISAGKSVLCAGSPGTYTCLLSGLNQNLIQNGVVALINVTVAISTATVNIGITRPMASSATGHVIPISATGGTVSVTSIGVSALTCNPSALLSGSASTCTATLNTTAPSPGAAVSLSSNATALSVPTTITVPAGASSATFTATAGAISTIQSVTVTAALNGTSRQTSILVAAQLVISSLRCNPSSILSLGSSTCSIVLNRSAYSSKATIKLQANNVLVTVPSSETVPSGTSTVSFTAKAAVIPVTGTALITASLGSSLQTTLLTLLPTGAAQPRLSLSCDEPTLIGGLSTQCTLQSSSPAPAGGFNVSLGVSDADLLVPSSVQLPEGSHAARFLARTRPTDQDHKVTLSAHTPVTSQYIHLSVLALKPASLTCTPHPRPRSGGLICEVHLNARLGEPVSLSVSGSSNLLLPTTILTRPEQSSLAFNAVIQPSSASEAFVQVGFGAQTATEHRWVPPTGARDTHSTVNIFVRVGEPIDLTLSTPELGPEQAHLSAPDLPSGARFDPSTARFTWTPARTQQGSYSLLFPLDGVRTNSPPRHLTITVDSGEPLVTAVVNGASHSADSACSPGSVASLQGRWLNDAGAPRVYVNGVAVSVLAASSTRVDFLCPQDTPGTPLQVWLENAAGRTDALVTTMKNSAPGIFTLTGASQGLVFLDNSLLAAVRGSGDSGQPAQPGDDVSIRATGFKPDTSISIKLGDLEALVNSVEPAVNLPGVYDIRIKVPSGVILGEEVPIRLRVADAGGQWYESNLATMAIELPRP